MTIWLCLGLFCVPISRDVHPDDCLRIVQERMVTAEIDGMWVRSWVCPPPIPTEKPDEN